MEKPVLCQSCGYQLGHLWPVLATLRGRLKPGQSLLGSTQQPIGGLLDRLNVRQHCCRTTMITAVTARDFM